MLTLLGRGCAALFALAGTLMLASVAGLAATRLALADVSLALVAPLALGAQAACVLALLGLRAAQPRPAGLARAGLAAAWTAALVLVGGVAVLGVAGEAGAGLLPLVGYAYTLAASLAFALYAGSVLLARGPSSALGLLLVTPALAWLPILVVGATAGPAAALPLDVYTNGPAALALLALAWCLRPSCRRHADS